MHILVLRTHLFVVLVTASAAAQTGASLVGHLDDEEDDPVTCAAIVVSDDDDFQRMNVTDAAGDYSITGLPAGEYTIEVFSPGLIDPDPKSAGIVDELIVTEEQANGGEEIVRDFEDLEFRSMPLSGTVRGRLVAREISGKGQTEPIGVPVVEVIARSEDCEILDFTYTCADGSFEVVIDDSLESARVEFSGGRVLLTGMDFELSDNDLTDLGEIEVVPLADVVLPAFTLEVVEADGGEPISGARIIGRNGTQTFTVFTNCTGLVEVDSLEVGGYNLTIVATGFEGRIRSVVADDTEIRHIEVALAALDPDAPPEGCRQPPEETSEARRLGDGAGLAAAGLILLTARRQRRHRN